MAEEEVLDRGDDDASITPDAEGDVKADVETAKAAEAEAAKVASEKSVTIPKARFDEAVGKEREARKLSDDLVRELQAKLKVQEQGADAQQVEADIVALEEKLDQAIADGDADGKKRLRAEIRGKQQALADAGAQRQAAYATAVAVERVRYDAEVSVLEAKYPAINPDHETYDSAVAGELLELKAAYEAAGQGSTDALKKAAKYVFKTAPEQVKAEKKEEGKPDEAAVKAAAEAAAKAKEEAIKKGLAAKAAQPAGGAGKGLPSDKMGAGHKEADVAKMSAKDFNKLTDEELSQARGDTL